MTAQRRRLWWLPVADLIVVSGILAVAIALWPRPRVYLLQGSAASSFSRPAYETLLQSRIFSDVVVYTSLPGGEVTTMARGRTAVAAGEMVSGNYFNALRVGMRIGAPFNAEDVRRHTPVVVLSLDLWTKLFHRDPDATGQPVYIDGVPFALFGVTAEGFRGTYPGHPADFWIPLEAGADHLHLLVQLPRGVDPRKTATQASWVAATSLTLTPVRE